MTEGTPSPAGAPGSAADRPEPHGLQSDDWIGEDEALAEEVGELFTSLAKALRSYRIYEENNPVRQRFVGGLRDAFGSLWKGMDRLEVRIEEEQIRWREEVVHRAEKGGGDSLPFLFYRDGIREMTLLPGIEEELEPLLEIVQTARRLKGEGDDLLTLLWHADLRHLRYQYVDLLDEGVEIPERGEGADSTQLRSVLEEEAPERGSTLREDVPPPKIDPENFNLTLYSLRPAELEELRDEVRREMERDLRQDVLDALFDRLEERENPGRQVDIIGILRTLLPNFLSRGALGSAARVLGELDRLLRAEGVLGSEAREAAEELLGDIGGVQALGELVRALTDGSLSPSPEELAGFLRHLHTKALAPLLRSAETVDDRRLQRVIRDAIGQIARKRPSELTVLLEHDDAVVVRGAARLIGETGFTGAGAALGRLLTHEDREVRITAVESARMLRASSAAGALVNALTDRDDGVRAAAARAVGALRYRPALGALRSRVRGKEIRQAHRTEKIAFFEAYGLVGGGEAVEELDELLNGRGFLGRRQPEEIRASAALALGKMEVPRAMEALERAMGDDNPVVQAAVNRALRGEPEGAS